MLMDYELVIGKKKVFQTKIPGAKNQPHVTIKDASHFIQDDKGEELAQLIIDFIARTTKK